MQKTVIAQDLYHISATQLEHLKVCPLLTWMKMLDIVLGDDSDADIKFFFKWA